RNLRLVELHHLPARPERPLHTIFWFLLVMFLTVLLFAITIFILLVWLGMKIFAALAGAA
ncbi:MAG: hypothetical protein ABJC04_09490, partial [Verrucomicrobiota bacterium]